MAVLTTPPAQPAALRRPPQLHHIGGAFRPSLAGDWFETFDPSDGSLIARVAAGTAADVDAAVASARTAFDDGPWPRATAKDRARVLRRLAVLMRENADELVALECLDVGMPVAQMRGLAERAAENFEFYAGVVEGLHGRAFQAGSAFLNYTLHKPVGVAGLIMPWNAPLMLTTWRLAPALAAGNTVVLKPAEWSPLTANRLAELCAEANVPDGVFNVVHGFGETAGAPLSSHPDVDLLCFTGETTTGATIMAAAAPTLKRLSMELGGKSPVLVFADCDLDRTVDAVVQQIFSMNGQRCTAGARLLVAEELHDEVVDRVTERARAIRIGPPTDPATELGPLIHPEHRARVLELVDSATAEGASVVTGGGVPAGFPDGNYVEPTVITGVRPEMRMFQEEVFGPVLSVTSFVAEERAVELANATSYGLAAYLFTSDIKRAHRVAAALDTGLCWINSHNVRDLRTPFGGVKRSGIGIEGGDYAFDFYCLQETVHVAVADNPIPRLGIIDDKPGA